MNEIVERRPFALGERWPKRSLVVLVILIAFFWSAKGARVAPGELLSGASGANMTKFITGLFPPDLSPKFLSSLIRPTVETIQMSIVGVVLGAVAAFPLSFLATRTLSSSQTPGTSLSSRLLLGHLPYLAARNFLNFLRAVPELVWALVFISAVGLGPFAGVLALAVHSTGLLGKLYAEAMESINLEPVEAVRALGGNRVKATAYAVLPQAAPNFVSLTLYQWECNARTATILGFVGAGGIGQSIDIAMRLFQYNEVLTLIAVVFGVVFLVDNASALIRKTLTSQK
ncbi:MAG: phosphonate ABC transporter, permease protein PhnE [Actinobacteria bacterium]|nr:phosphonate ABC transporter, permease protein PhnE [Actinomycetota bacterium]